VLTYPAFDVSVTTPRLELRSATDDLLGQLVPLVRQGKAAAEPPPYDDPISFYEKDPEVRVQRWLQAIWRGRGRVEPDSWRLYFAVVVGGEPVGMQDLIGDRFSTLGSVTTFSWLSADARGMGLGREMRAAVLQLAFEGLGAREASSDAFLDNHASNAVSRALGYAENGTDWDTRQGEPALLQRWRLTREAWMPQRRSDIDLRGVAACRTLLSVTEDR
jgi:RimJ/RimL family protein N-acetyltransferase